MTLKKRKLLGSFSRFKLILTLGVAVLLPAAGLIYVNYSQLRSFERDKVLEAAIHRDFQERLALTEKRMNKKLYSMVDETRDLFPSPDSDQLEIEVKLEEILAKNRWMSDIMFFNEKNLDLHSQPDKIER